MELGGVGIGPQKDMMKLWGDKYSKTELCDGQTRDRFTQNH